MAELARITPSGWVHGDDADTFARVSPDGWEHQESAAAPGGSTFQKIAGNRFALAGPGGLAA